MKSLNGASSRSAWRAEGGRERGTGCYSVTVDLDEKWINAGCYRATSMDIVVTRMGSTPADPRVTTEQRQVRDFTNSRMIIDVTQPLEGGRQIPHSQCAELGRGAQGARVCRPTDSNSGLFGIAVVTKFLAL